MAELVGTGAEAARHQVFLEEHGRNISGIAVLVLRLPILYPHHKWLHGVNKGMMEVGAKVNVQY